MQSLLGFLVILAPLVIVHELGHFIFAKVFGVKAEAFSIGFGPRLWRRQIGETEFRVSAIPLGGYVKLLGEEPGVELTPEERLRSLPKAAAWKRFFIFFGGPLFNFVFAIIVFMAILAIGEPRLSNVVGRVISGSHAEKVGFQSGDQILEVDGEPVTKFEHIYNKVQASVDKAVQFKVLRQGSTEPLLLSVEPKKEEGYSIYGELKDVGTIDGLDPIPRSGKIGISNPNSLAAKQGLKTGDLLVSFNGQPLANWEVFEKYFYNLKQGQTVELGFKPDGKKSAPEKTFTFKRTASSKTPTEEWGIGSVELFIDQVVDKSPAQKAGIKAGDRIIAVDGKTVTSFYGLKDSIQESSKQNGKVKVAWERDGKYMTSELAPTETKGRDPNLKKTSDFTIGVVPMNFVGEPVTVIERTWNPFTLVYKATERMLIFTWRNIVSIGKMITGNVSVATLGGPILIGKIAGDSLERGLIAFLTTMAILSVGLGILNVLPIPVLDGGHLLLLGIEVVRGKPLSIRQTEIIQQVGLSLILLLMVVVIRNDLARLPIFNN